MPVGDENLRLEWCPFGDLRRACGAPPPAFDTKVQLRRPRSRKALEHHMLCGCGHVDLVLALLVVTLNEQSVHRAFDPGVWSRGVTDSPPSIGNERLVARRRGFSLTIGVLHTRYEIAVGQAIVCDVKAAAVQRASPGRRGRTDAGGALGPLPVKGKNRPSAGAHPLPVKGKNRFLAALAPHSGFYYPSRGEGVAERVPARGNARFGARVIAARCPPTPALPHEGEGEPVARPGKRPGRGVDRRKPASDIGCNRDARVPSFLTVVWELIAPVPF